MRKIIIAIILFLMVGEVLNIVKFVKCDFASPWKDEVIYGIGIFTGIPFGFWNFE